MRYPHGQAQVPAGLTDVTDVRDEGLTVGSVALTDRSMVWTDATNGDSGRVHVRDLETGEETAFDPGAGERCNLLGFGATAERVVMSQYCGTYEDGVRDDRVQVVDTEGRQVVTLQGSEIEGALTTDAEGLTVAVQDNGPGVPPEQQALIFEKFRQGGDEARRPQGTGLGLPISRRIVEHFGGRMGLRDDAAQGACFWFTLPLQPRPDQREGDDR